MKICLINPPMKRQDKLGYICGHLGVGYIASSLINVGHEVYLIDCPSDKLTQQDVINVLTINTFDVIGISMYFFNYAVSLRILNFIRNVLHTTFVFAGGYLPTISYQKIGKTLPADCMIIGEGEAVVVDVLNKLENNLWKNVPGVAYYDSLSDQIVCTGRRNLIKNLDLLPFPQRPESNQEEIDIISSRGCYGCCCFCAIRTFYANCIGSVVRRRSPENVIEEIEELIRDRRLSKLNFADDCFSIAYSGRQSWLRRFVTSIKEKNIRIRYSCFIRANEIDENKDGIQQFAQIGLSFIFVGIESFLQHHLDFYNKKVTVEQNINALEILDKVGVRYNIGYLLFNPLTTMEDIVKTIGIFKRLKFNEKHKHIIDTIGATCLSVTDGSTFYEYVRQNGMKAKNERGYVIPDKQVELCYQVMKRWAITYFDIIITYSMRKIVEDYDSDHAKQIRFLLYKLFLLDMEVLIETSQSIMKQNRSTIEEFTADFKRWDVELERIHCDLKKAGGKVNA